MQDDFFSALAAAHELQIACTDLLLCQCVFIYNILCMNGMCIEILFVDPPPQLIVFTEISRKLKAELPENEARVRLVRLFMPPGFEHLLQYCK